MQKGARIFVRGHYLLREANSFNFLERGSRESTSFKEQIMSKDKYPIIFSPQMEAIVFIILHMFFATPKVLKVRGYYTLNALSRGKQLVLYSPRVPMFPETKSRETSILEGKQN